MPSLEVEICGLKSKNPFWLASSPVSNSAAMISRAFEAGWAGCVYKSLGIEDKPGQPAAINVTPRLAPLLVDGKMVGLENIELITDRPLSDNLKDIAQLKRNYPQNLLFVSIMALPVERDWKMLARVCEDAGADGLELNFSCPHGSMRGQRAGSSIGQDPEIAGEVTAWVKEASSLPIMVKLPAEVPDIGAVGRAVRIAGANAVAAINTVPCIMGVDLDTLSPIPSVFGVSTHGGYSGPAVKPIGLKKVADLSLDPEVGLPIAGIGGIATWRDALEYILLGATVVQICTAAMHYGYRIIAGLTDGLSNWMEEKGYTSLRECCGLSLGRLKHPNELDRAHRAVAKIHPELCARDDLCFLACQDGGHQAIALQTDRLPAVDEQKCAGCGLCAAVCPILGCMEIGAPGRS